jgi:tetratricopeptide (TPR) repeat protein
MVIFRFRKNKELILGAGLFLLTILINLPLNSVRNVIYTDRYAYFPYLGLLVIVATYYQTFFERYYETRRTLVFGITTFIIFYSLFLSYETKTRNKVWSGDIILTTDIINKNPSVPSMSKVYRIRGENYAHHQETEKSISDFTKAIELDSMDINIYIYRAYAYIKGNRLNDALPDLNKAIFYRPGISVLYANRAMVKLNTGDRMGAWQDCNKCLSLDPTNAESYNFLAILKFGSNDLQGAEKDLRNAIRYNDQYAEAYKNLGIVLFQLKKTDQACYYWDIASRFGDRQSIQFLKINCLHK